MIGIKLMQTFSYKNKLYSIFLAFFISSCASGPYQHRFVEPYGDSEKSKQYWSIFKVDYSQVQEKKNQLDSSRNILFCQNEISSCNQEEVKDIKSIDTYKIELYPDLAKRYSFDKLKGDSFNYGFDKVRFFKSGFCGENGSCFGDISKGTGRAKTVFVNGYTRSDGTYVRSHYRSPPSGG